MVGMFCMLQMSFFPTLYYKYYHDITSDRFSTPPTNGHNDVIHGGFSMDVPAKPVKNRPSSFIKQYEKKLYFLIGSILIFDL